MVSSNWIRTTLAIAAACSVSACGPTHDCKCHGRDVNASIWGTDDGTLFVVGYNGFDRGLVKTSTGSGFTLSEFFDLPLTHGWGTSASDYFVVAGSAGSASVVHRTNGPAQVWGAAGNSAPVSSASRIWGARADSVFVVGAGGSIAHFDGDGWTEQETPLKEDLHDVWGSAEDDVFAVGSKGAVLHYDGSSWSSIESSTAANLSAVWGSSAEDVFVVGESEPEAAHVILHYDGVSFEVVHQGDRALLGVHGAAADRVVAVGGKRVGTRIEAAILKFDGSAWTEASSDAATFLWDVWVDADGSGYTVVGPEDTILHQSF